MGHSVRDVVGATSPDRSRSSSQTEVRVSPHSNGTAGNTDYDVLIIGSGFGGSVSALRLTEKGYRVGVLEAGPRRDESTLPKTSYDFRNFLWAPALGWYGIQRIHLLRNVVILAGAGVGGGSLNYANTLYEPLAPFFADKQWSHITDWKSELAPYYDQAKRMLGVVNNPTFTPADAEMKKVAQEMGVEHTFRPTPVGVFFGGPGTTPGQTIADPYFGGAGPERTTCVQCGECMTGCRRGAKNMLTKNYLFMAEALGTEVHPMVTVTRVRPAAGGAGYEITTVPTNAKRKATKVETVFTAREVIVAAGTMGTQRLLHKMVDSGDLPHLSKRLGMLTRTNSEALLGVQARDKDRYDFTQGVAITSSFHPDDHTHIEPCRYGHGSGAMGLLKTLATDGRLSTPRWKQFFQQLAKDPKNALVGLDMRKWSERTIIALVMQSLDNSINVRPKKTRLGKLKLTSDQGHGEPNPTFIPAGHEATQMLAENIDGIAGGTWGELANIPMTAHFLGGCAIGDSAETGVIDAYHRVYGYPGMHIVDGSSVSANLGVNPSLTITAQAERAMSLWPNKGEEDRRPTLGTAYERLAPIPPAAPAVPADAPGALRLPWPVVRTSV
jgi:cholesterol oxidase